MKLNISLRILLAFPKFQCYLSNVLHMRISCEQRIQESYWLAYWLAIHCHCFFNAPKSLMNTIFMNYVKSNHKKIKSLKTAQCELITRALERQRNKQKPHISKNIAPKWETFIRSNRTPFWGSIAWFTTI